MGPKLVTSEHMARCKVSKVNRKIFRPDLVKTEKTTVFNFQLESKLSSKQWKHPSGFISSPTLKEG